MVKQVLWKVCASGDGRVNREGEGGRLWWIYFVYMYEKKAIKPDEIVLKCWGGRRRENDEGVNLTKIYHKYTCKYHNVSPCTIVIY
jgi:hypothetical protein